MESEAARLEIPIIWHEIVSITDATPHLKFKPLAACLMILKIVEGENSHTITGVALEPGITARIEQIQRALTESSGLKTIPVGVVFVGKTDDGTNRGIDEVVLVGDGVRWVAEIVDSDTEEVIRKLQADGVKLASHMLKSLGFETNGTDEGIEEIDPVAATQSLAEGSGLHTEQQSRRQICCHEAGHAVASVLNGATLMLLVSDPNAAMTDKQRELYCSVNHVSGERGSTIKRCKERTCKCGAVTVRNRPNPSMSAMRLNRGCADCEDILIHEFACVLAGRAATLQLMPEVQNDADGTRDIATVLRTAEELNLADQDRQAILNRAIVRAHTWIRQESRAVLTLAEALLNDVVLDGEAAERIVRANLNGAI